MTIQSNINGNNVHINKIEGNVIIGGGSTPTTTASSGIISDAQAKNIMTIIKAMVTLDTEQGRVDQQALLFHIANKAAGVDSYKNIPAAQYQTALAALEKHLRTRKLQTCAK